MSDQEPADLKRRLLAAENAALADTAWLEELRAGMEIQRRRETFWSRLARGLWLATGAALLGGLMMAFVLPVAAPEILILLTALFPAAGVLCFAAAAACSVVWLAVRHTAGTRHLQSALVSLTVEVRRLQSQRSN